MSVSRPAKGSTIQAPTIANPAPMPTVTVASRPNAASSALGEIAFLGDLRCLPTLPDIPEMSRLASVKNAAQHYHSPAPRSSKNASKFLGFRRFQEDARG